MKNFSAIHFALGSILFLGGLSSCVSTEVVEPNELEKSSRIVLNLSAPEAVKTRADGTHKLRYVAKLYHGNLTNLGTDVYYRKEIIEGDDSEGEQANQIIFDVPASEINYTIIVFADYIPVSFNKNGQGLFDDYYYNTTPKDYFEIRTTPGQTSNNISEAFFNNDNYDCFYNHFSVKKTEEKVVMDLTLNRIVSKIRFVDTSNTSGNTKIDISKAGIYTWYALSNDGGGANMMENRKGSVSLTNNFSGEGEEEFLYYYSFATKDKTPREKAAITMVLSGNNREDNTVDLNNIEINQNYITTVKGKFVPEEKDAPPTPEEPDEEDTKGPIYVNINLTSEPWQNSTSDWK